MGEAWRLTVTSRPVEAMTARRVLCCYVSGLDLRRVAESHTPFLSSALARYSWAPFVNLPSNELFPTLVTGVDPTVHGVWGVRLEPGARRSKASAVLAALPDGLATATQGALHVLTRSFDLAAIAPRRRARFRITRTKYKRRIKRREALFGIGGVPTVFDVVGAQRSRYLFDSRCDPERTLLPHLCADPYVLEVVELYSLDRYQQWNLDRPERVADFYARIDAFVRRLHARCEAKGRSLLIVSDHGHEPIRSSLDLTKDLAALGVPAEAYSWFLEVSSARFWFHTDEARRRVLRLLAELPHATILRYDEMARHGLPLRDASYGEFFVYLDPGYIFFPHDFHHPLANLWLGLTDPMQRSRLRDPRHRGNHGHLPHFDAERSFALFLDESFEPTGDPATVLDVAPSILSLLGCEAPTTMKGRRLFLQKGP
jgi:hypothetical protein